MMNLISRPMDAHSTGMAAVPETTAIAVIRNFRNALLAGLGDDAALRRYLDQRLTVNRLSDTKVLFVRRALEQLAQAPVDLVHYATLILVMRKHELMTVRRAQECFFHDEIRKTVENYLL